MRLFIRRVKRRRRNVRIDLRRYDIFMPKKYRKYLSIFKDFDYSMLYESFIYKFSYFNFIFFTFFIIFINIF